MNKRTVNVYKRVYVYKRLVPALFAGIALSRNFFLKTNDTTITIKLLQANIFMAVQYQYEDQPSSLFPSILSLQKRNINKYQVTPIEK